VVVVLGVVVVPAVVRLVVVFLGGSVSGFSGTGYLYPSSSPFVPCSCGIGLARQADKSEETIRKA
jgi:hypothetical protein